MSVKFALTATPNPVKFSPLLYCGPVENAFRKAAGFGYDGVEIHLRDTADVSAAGVRKLMKETGLAVTTLGTGIAAFEYGINFAHPDAAVRRRAVDHVKKFVDLAAELESAVTIGLMTGKAGRDAARETRISAAGECLAECRAAAEKAGVTLLLEALNRYESDYIVMQEDAADAARKAGGAPYRILADTFHMNIEEKSIAETLKRRADVIGYVHFADSNRRYPGSGHTDFAAAVRALRETNYDGYVSFECLPLPDPDTAARESIGYIKKLLAL